MMKKLHLYYYILPFILIRFISIGVLESAQTQNTTTSTILIIARRYGGKIYKIVFLYMEQYYRVYSILYGVSSRYQTMV